MESSKTVKGVSEKKKERRQKEKKKSKEARVLVTYDHDQFVIVDTHQNNRVNQLDRETLELSCGGGGGEGVERGGRV